MADTSKPRGMACTGSNVPDKTNRSSKQALGRSRFILYTTTLFCLYSKLILLLIYNDWTTPKLLPHDDSSISRCVWGEPKTSPKKGERREVTFLLYREGLGTLSKDSIKASIFRRTLYSQQEQISKKA